MSDKELFVYLKLPATICISTILPKKITTWEGTRVLKNGSLSTPQKIVHPSFADFLNSRVKCMDDNQISNTQVNKIVESMLKDKKRLLKSKSLDVFIHEEFRKI